MKMFLKGGTCIEVSGDDYFCIITDKKVGFSLNEEKREAKVWSKTCLTSFDDFVVPREFVERIEL